MRSRFELETALAAWRRSLAHNAAFLAEDVDELERHVRDQITAHTARGVAPEIAFHRALEEMGDYGSVETEYRKVFWGKRRRRRELADELSWRVHMLKSYITSTLRQLRRYSGYASINVGGLALGLASCLLILLFVRDELSYDAFHEKADRIYRIEQVSLEGGEVAEHTAYPLAPSLEEMFPDIQRTVRFGQDAVQVTRGDASFREEGFYWTDSTVFGVFDFPMLQGDPRTALAKTNAVVITEEMAVKYFGEEDPLGKTLSVKIFDGNRLLPLEVTGVLQNVPSNSHLQFDFLASMSTGIDIYRQFETFWGLTWLRTFVLLPERYPTERIEARMPAFLDRYIGEGVSELVRLQLQPLPRIHLYAETGSTRAIAYVYVFTSIAVLILLLACINYMNLATAQATRRSREVGVRKVLGAHRTQVAGQFIGEAVAVVGLAMLLAVGLAVLLLPSFNAVAGKSLTLQAFMSAPFLLGMGMLALLVGLLSGGYPALLFSAFRPVDVLKGSGAGRGGHATLLRKGLIVVQFTLSTVLLIGTAVVHRQMDYLRTTDLGFDREQLLTIPVDDRSVQAQMEPMKEAIRLQPGVQRVAMSSEALPSHMNNSWSVYWDNTEGGTAELTMHVVSIDYDLFDMLGTRFVEGRNFSEAFATDATAGFILNETAVRAMGWNTAAGRALTVGNREGTVVGVVEDFHFASLHEAIKPVVYFILPGTERASPDNFIVRVTERELPATLEGLETLWARFSSEQPFEVAFVDHRFAALYRAEERLARLFDAFSLLAVVIACLGLLGLASYMADRRTKELGIRKVLGASGLHLVFLLSREFLLWVGIAFVAAAPVAYFITRRWLDDFAYRIDLSVWTFLGVGAAVLLTALATVSYHALRAARTDPVKSLRYE